MKRLATSIPDPLFARLEKIAKTENRSLSGLVAYLLERSLEERMAKE
jgi:metal-responsive CopG/Arc/MetJ family transcriptional regulator